MCIYIHIYLRKSIFYVEIKHYHLHWRGVGACVCAVLHHVRPATVGGDTRNVGT